jgi:hypothetical protein
MKIAFLRDETDSLKKDSLLRQEFYRISFMKNGIYFLKSSRLSFKKYPDQKKVSRQKKNLLQSSVRNIKYNLSFRLN